MTVTVRYWAAARAAAGVAEDVLDVLAPTTVGACLAAAQERHGGQSGRLARVLDLASVLVDGRRVDRSAYAATHLDEGAVVEVLPPFAGG